MLPVKKAKEPDEKQKRNLVQFATYLEPEDIAKLEALKKNGGYAERETSRFLRELLRGAWDEFVAKQGVKAVAHD